MPNKGALAPSSITDDRQVEVKARTMGQCEKLKSQLTPKKPFLGNDIFPPLLDHTLCTDRTRALSSHSLTPNSRTDSPIAANLVHYHFSRSRQGTLLPAQFTSIDSEWCVRTAMSSSTRYNTPRPPHTLQEAAINGNLPIRVSSQF